MLSRSHLMNTLSYENYCLKAKLQELLEKIAKLQTDLLHNNTSTPVETDQSNNAEINEYKEMINKRDLEIVYLKEMITTLTSNLPPEKDESSDPEQVNKLQEQISKYAMDMKNMGDEMNKLQCIILVYETQISDLTNQLSTKDQQISDLTTQLATKDQQITDLMTQLATKDQQIADLMTQLATKDQQITSKHEEKEQLKTILAGKDAEIAHLKANIQ